MEGNGEEHSEEFKPNPLKAAGYSLIFPGLGQIYNGDTGRGSYYFVLGFIMVVSAYLVIPIFIYFAFLLYNIHDAYSSAKKKNEKENQE